MQKRDLTQLLFRVRDVFNLFSRSAEGVFDAAIEDGVEYVFLAFEVEIDGAVGNPASRAMSATLVEVTVVREDTDSRAQNRFALIASGHAGTIE